jgi:type I restriction enzyme R subunit
MSTLGGEKYSVQNPIINYVKEEYAGYISQDGTESFLKLGWQYVKPDEALRLRGGETGMVFREIFVSQLQKLNPDFTDRCQGRFKFSGFSLD